MTDPAREDSELSARLQEQRKVAKKNLDDVFDEFAQIEDHR